MADREWWNKVEELYHAARELDAEQRAGFLDQACDADHSLRKKVEALLSQDGQRDSLLDTAAVNFTDAALTPGTRVGPYEVLAAIGAGGMGQVFRARDTRLNRDIAIKALPEDFASDAGRLARFQR